MSDVFISYSRKNSDFARKLTDHLRQVNKESWVDWEGIPLSAPDWWNEIKTGIEQADNFIFIMSPDSMASVVCNMELDYAFESGKRVVPVMYHEISSKDAFASIADYTPDKAMEERLQGKKPIVIAADNWQRISHINWTYFRDEDNFETAFADLIKTVETDLAYVKAHTRYLTRANEWDENGRRTDLLLFGQEIDRAEDWLTQAQDYTKQAQQKSDDKPTNAILQSLQQAYIEASRADDTRRKRLANSARLSIVVLALVLMGGGIFGFIALTGLNEQIDDANNQLGTATQVLVAVGTDVADAEAQVDAASTDVSLANNARNQAESDVNAAGTEVGLANNQLATATQALVTATRVAELEAEAQVTLGAVSTLVADAFITVTQAAIDQDITFVLVNELLDIRNSPELSLTQMTELIDRYPQEGRTYQARGLVHDALSQYELAVEDYTTALQMIDDEAQVYYNRGNAYFLLQEYDLAIADYSEVLAQDSHYEDVLTNRGNTYRQIGRYDEALEDYNRHIELDPNAPLPYVNRGRLWGLIGDFDNAIDDFTRVIELDPFSENAYFLRGGIYAEQGNYEQPDLLGKAIKDLNRSIELGSNDALVLRGTLFFILEEYEQSIADFDLYESRELFLPQNVSRLRQQAQDLLASQ